MSSKKVIITCDSACDLPKKFLSKNKVKVVPLQILLGDDSYKDDGSLSPDKIYEIYKEKGILPKTAAFSPQTVIDFWKPFNDKGYEIVHIDLSSELSSTFREFEQYQGMCKFPDCTHRVEKGCAVLEALTLGKIASSRHESYLALYETLKNIKQWETKK